MSKIIRAEITPSTISWAIRYSNIDRNILSSKMGVPLDKIESWDKGEAFPTINQLFKLAKICDVPFSLFFFDSPPDDFPISINDYRKFQLEYGPNELSYELTLEIRNATRIRKISLDLYEEMDITPPEFSFTIIPANQSKIKLAQEIRAFLGISFYQQSKWSQKRTAFNQWRRALENKSIIVLQSTQVNVETMRGFSLSESPLPVIVVNRKDELSGRIFSLLHEFVHIATNTSGLCDFLSETEIEVFCNSLAAEILMPNDDFLREVMTTTISPNNPTEYEISKLSKIFSVSKISVVRHLLTKNFISKEFYRTKQSLYNQEYEKVREERKKSNGFIIQRSAIDAISQKGHLYPSLVMDAVYDKKITPFDALNLLNLKSRHLDDLFTKLAKNQI